MKNSGTKWVGYREKLNSGCGIQNNILQVRSGARDVLSKVVMDEVVPALTMPIAITIVSLFGYNIQTIHVCMHN